MVGLDEVCGTGVDVIAIMIHEECTRGSTSFQINVFTGVAWQLAIRWGGQSDPCGRLVGEKENKKKKKEGKKNVKNNIKKPQHHKEKKKKEKTQSKKPCKTTM